MGIVDGEMLVNPSRALMASSTLNLIVTGGPGSQVGKRTGIYSTDRLGFFSRHHVFITAFC